MTKGVGDSLNWYTVTLDLRFDDLTIRRFTRGEAIRHSCFVILDVRQVPMLDIAP
jgi:hypothetical protein